MRTLRGKWWILGLIVIGSTLILAGVSRWRRQREPETVVRQFVAALIAGDSEAAIRLLAPEQAAAARRQVAEHAADWVPAPTLKFRLKRLDVKRDTATAEVWLIDAGYCLRPVLTLRHTPAGWSIADIDNLVPDPRWEAARQREQAREDEQLAEELSTALRDLPGVIPAREDSAKPARR